MNAGETVWVLGSAALFMFMTPGLALFYGGLIAALAVRLKRPLPGPRRRAPARRPVPAPLAVRHP